jgi:hypothetical protein
MQISNEMEFFQFYLINSIVEYIFLHSYHMNNHFHNNESKQFTSSMTIHFQFQQTLSEQQEASGYGQHP